ncbi:MAG: hypothetical protein FWC77_06020 [Defluviitaleaceae bacterium]|nr:hypothetical protein [Defluviitaleaceae bacterium]
MKRLFLVLAVVLTLGISFAIHLHASEPPCEPPQLLDLELRPASPITWPNSSAVFFTLMELEDDVDSRTAIALRWQMEGHDLGDMLTVNPFGATLLTGSSQNQREITITAFYNEEIYSTATIEVIPARNAKSMEVTIGLSTPSIAPVGEPSYGVTVKGFFLDNVPDGIFQVALISHTDALFLEDSKATYIPRLGATVTTGTVEVTDGWGEIIVGYDTADIHVRTNNISMLLVWNGEYDDDDFFVFGGMLDTIFVIPYFPMQLGMPVWYGPRTHSGINDWSGLPPSFGDFESVVTFRPMMISGPFVDTEVNWEIEGMVDGDWFEEYVWFSERAGHYASSGWLHLGESLEEREITVTITWVDDEDFYDSETLFISPSGVNIVPLQRNVLVAGGDFVEIPVKVWGVEDGVYHSQVSFTRTAPPGLTAFHEDTRMMDYRHDAFYGKVEVIDGIATFLLGIEVGRNREWFTYFYEGGTYLIEFAIFDPQFLGINDWGKISAMIPVQILPVE